MAEKADVLLIGPPKPVIVNGLSGAFNLVKFSDAKDRDRFFVESAPRVRGMAVAATEERVDGPLMERFPRLEIVASFGVGYDHVDAVWAGAHGITVTNTPDVLTEEVADTALGLLLCTAREFPQAERYLRAGRWLKRNYPLSKATVRSAWGASGSRSRAGSPPCRCPSSIIRGGRPRACPTGTIPSSSTWRATSTCSWSSRRAVRRPRT